MPFCPENKTSPQDNICDYMNEMKPNKCTQNRIVVGDWTDNKNYLTLYRMLKRYGRHGMVVREVHEKNPFRQSKWLEKYISLNTQKTHLAVNDFEKDFYKILNNTFYGKALENDSNRIKIEFIRKGDNQRNIKQQ